MSLVAGQGHSPNILEVRNNRKKKKKKEWGSITENQWLELPILTCILYFEGIKNMKIF